MAAGAQIAARIDHAYLKVERDTSVAGLRDAVSLVRDLGLRSLCVPPLLAGTVKKHNPGLRVSAVVSYPLGNDSLAGKIFTASELIEQHVDELDVVMDLFAILNNNWDKLRLEAQSLLPVVKPAGLLKCIIETPLLSEDQIRRAGEVLVEAGVDCIKTSTGYHREATSPEHVRLLRQVAGERCLIKASGGIRSLEDARLLLDCGADILGASASAAICAEAVAAGF